MYILPEGMLGKRGFLVVMMTNAFLLFCLEISEFRCQNTGIFSIELELSRKNAHFSEFSHVVKNQRLTVLWCALVFQKEYFFIAKSMILGIHNIYS